MRRLTWAFSLAALTNMALLIVQAGPLRTAAAPLGMTSFMFAGEVHTAQAILDSWSAAGVMRLAEAQIGLDCLFPFLYPVAIGAGLWLFGWRTLAGLQIIAGILDHCENALLLGFLHAPPADPWPGVVWVLAALKYGIALGGVVAFLGLLARQAVVSSSPVSPGV